MLYRLQRPAICSNESVARGAKQLVVVKTQTILSEPSVAIWASMFTKSVRSSSPDTFGSITIGWRPEKIPFQFTSDYKKLNRFGEFTWNFNLPAVMMHLKQAFWSMRDHKTNLAPGRSCLNVSIQRTKLIPVAIGTIKHPAELFTPRAMSPIHSS